MPTFAGNWERTDDGGIVEATLELRASSLCDVKARIGPLFTQAWVAASAGLSSVSRSGLAMWPRPIVRRTLAGYEAMAKVRKEQVPKVAGRKMRAQASFVAILFRVAA